jgi:hypothetical protein
VSGRVAAERTATIIVVPTVASVIGRPAVVCDAAVIAATAAVISSAVVAGRD